MSDCLLKENSSFSRSFAWLCIFSVLFFCQPRHALAFVCSRVQDQQTAASEDNASLSWGSRTLTFTRHEPGTEAYPDNDEWDVIAQSFAVWETLTTPENGRCASGGSDLSFVERNNTANVLQIGYNHLDPSANQNLIVFQDESWPYPELGSSVIALTTATFDAISGEILDADIEFNSALWNFSPEGGIAHADLANTAVHEIGHFLGLAHSAIPEASMFGNAATGETQKAILDCDDIQAIQLKYPAAEDNGYCEPDTINASCGFCAPPTESPTRPIIEAQGPFFDPVAPSGCQTTFNPIFAPYSHTPSINGSMLLALGILAIMAQRRKRRRRSHMR